MWYLFRNVNAVLVPLASSLRLADVNVRPAEAARLLRLAEADAGDSEGIIRADAHRRQT